MRHDKERKSGAAFQDEIGRYARHIVLSEIGGPGQQKLKAARVLVIGAGGLGAPLIQYLAAAGVGTIGICDDDTVSLSNLQRQIIHTTDRIGEAKTQSAAAAVAALNPHVNVVRHDLRLTAENAPALLAAYDLMADGSDNFATRYLSADMAEAARIPLVTGAVGRFDGSVTVLKPYEQARMADCYPAIAISSPSHPRRAWSPPAPKPAFLARLLASSAR